MPRYIRLDRLPADEVSLFFTDGTKHMEPFVQARRFLPEATVPNVSGWDPELGLDVAVPELASRFVFYVKPSDDPITRPPEPVEHARILCADPQGTAIIGVLPERHQDHAGRKGLLWMRLFRAETGPDGYRAIHQVWRSVLIDARIDAELQRIYIAESCDPAGESVRIQAALAAADADDAAYERRVQALLRAHGLDEVSRVANQRRILEAAGLTSVQVNARREAIVVACRAELKARLRLEQPSLFEKF